MRLLGKLLLGLVVAGGLVAGFMWYRADRQRAAEADYHRTLPKTITLLASHFRDGGDLPADCNCRGGEVSPELYWQNLPAKTRSMVLLMTDYDAPTPAFAVYTIAHWVMYNIPTTVPYIPRGVTPEQIDRVGAKVGKNSLDKTTYTGPCPRAGRHGYVFRLYALDTRLMFPEAPTKQNVLDAMRGHVLGYGELTGYDAKP